MNTKQYVLGSTSLTRPHFVQATLSSEGPSVLTLEYMAQDPHQLAEHVTGTSLVLSLMKAIEQHQPSRFPPARIRIEFPANFVGSGISSANYLLLIEAMALGLPDEEALSCTHFDDLAKFCGYELESILFEDGYVVRCSYLLSARTPR